jgi:hypothetical protein
MNADERITADWDTLLANFAAELTSAAYPIALRHGIEDSWVDLELDLWRVLAETVKKWGAEIAAGRTEAALNARAANCREESTYANRQAGARIQFPLYPRELHEPEMAYYDPAQVLDFCIRNLTRKVVMHHHYERVDVAVFTYR